jgi:hypothetical protein
MNIAATTFMAGIILGRPSIEQLNVQFSRVSLSDSLTMDHGTLRSPYFIKHAH